MSSNITLQVTSLRDGTRVIDAGSTVVIGNIAFVRFVDAVSQTSSRGCASGSFHDHFVDGRCRARRRDLLIVVARGISIVVLHKAGIADAQVGGVDSWAAMRFLHYHSQDKSMVDASSIGSLLDTIVDSFLYVTAISGKVTKQ